MSKKTDQKEKENLFLNENLISETETEAALFTEVSNTSEVNDTIEEFNPFAFENTEFSAVNEAIWASYTAEELTELMGEPIKSPNNEDVSLKSIIGKDDRYRIRPTSFPFTAICALRMTTRTGRTYIGSGFFVSPRIILTAGHCVYMHDQGGWAKSIEVIPALDDNSRPYCSSVSYRFCSLKGWVNNKDWKYDFGIIVLPENAKLGNRTGWFGYLYRSSMSYYNNLLVNLSGYPGDKGGNQQWAMCGRTGTSIQTSYSKLEYEIDTYGGHSGSPVWVYTSNGRHAVGVHTNGSSRKNYGTRINKSIFELIRQYTNAYP